MAKKDLQKLCLSWKIRSDEITKTPAIGMEVNNKNLTKISTYFFKIQSLNEFK
jgi:hypothetical protein